MKELRRADPAGARTRLKIFIRGLVQGVGFRPFIYRLASEMRLMGWVKNSAQGVMIEVEGVIEALECFLTRLKKEKPELSSIQGLEFSYLDCLGYEAFEIRESDAGGERTTLILPDIATCEACRADIFDPRNRRYRYPFTNCTYCGPRYSILEALPYDRAQTTMKKFKMCPACETEYHDPKDRRFHAQPNACSDCGPQLEFWSQEGRVLARKDKALLAAAAAIRRGEIVAIKGLGGFQLMVDAFNPEAVEKLRRKKHREEKPFALMFPDFESVRKHCLVTAAEERLVKSPEAPIVLLRRRQEGIAIAGNVAFKNPYLGVMLPCTPMHHLLLAELKIPVVATSGNFSEDPMISDEGEALGELRVVADYFLVHDRPIARAVDDSIARVVLGREMILRRARGLAPLPMMVRFLPEASVLAVGAHFKSTIAQSVGDQIFLSQHLGDLGTLKSVDGFKRTVHTFEKFYGRAPEVLAGDLHSEYFSTRYARRARLPFIQIQHHYAHVLSCMAENELEGPVLGVSWDGTGLGPDGTLWGGEFLQVDREGFSRAAHFRRFKLPGGEKAIQEPRRSALGLLYEVFGEDLFEMGLGILNAFRTEELSILRVMLRRNIQSPLTSSAGRLFDAVAALLNIRTKHAYEAQAAMELEFLAEDCQTDESYPVHFCEPLASGESLVYDWEPLVRGILADQESGNSSEKIAAKFHNTLAEVILQVCERAEASKVALTGGCFQNRYLLERSVLLLRKNGFQPYWHQRIPPNDGGIALGQILGAARVLKSEKNLKERALCV